MKIAMLISGGVDSSVALRLLKDEGHELTAFYLKIWLEDELAYLGECPWEEDLSYVRQVCEDADVPLEVISMQKEYWDNVVTYTINECKAGRTPNPDIFCNQLIKFGHFYSKIDDSFEKVATGHYARVSLKCECESQVPISGFKCECESQVPNCSLKCECESQVVSCLTSQVSRLTSQDCEYLLKTAPDPIKDQTYFLSYLSQEQLSRALFPIGKYKKSEVRELAEKYDLPNKKRKDSQGICFLGKIPYREFIKEHLGEKPGDFVEQGTSDIVGEHKGHWFYTIGQRTGLGLSGGPWFVVGKDAEKNVIYLANGYDPSEVYRSDFDVAEINWIAPKTQNSKLKAQKNTQFPIHNSQLRVKVRHGASIHLCTVKQEGDRLHVTLKEPVHGIAPGQFAVFYLSDGQAGDGDICLGGGKIT